ncbi:hypothetical protein FOCC_FOCC002686 [Frankliniella occidentalis]|nr:hypothetical protein FOCC_FOCC002686 [Frankliniella occidentalis]
MRDSSPPPLGRPRRHGILRTPPPPLHVRPRGGGARRARGGHGAIQHSSVTCDFGESYVSVVEHRIRS